MRQTTCPLAPFQASLSSQGGGAAEFVPHERTPSTGGSTGSTSTMGTTCRAATGTCDSAEKCNGSSPACPPDASQPDGTICDEGNGACSEGACEPLAQGGAGGTDNIGGVGGTPSGGGGDGGAPVTGGSGGGGASTPGGAESHSRSELRPQPRRRNEKGPVRQLCPACCCARLDAATPSGCFLVTTAH